jgi:cobalt-zinc-cadmium efflux system outer membrane protein
MRFPSLPAMAGVLAFLSSGLASAQGAENLDFSAALRRALEKQPQLAGFVHELRAQEARAGEAALAPATSIGLLVEDVAGDGARRGFDAAQSTLTLSRVIELGGKRDARVAAADAERSRLTTRRAAAQLDAAAEVARRFVETLHEREAVRIAGEELQQAEATHLAVERRVRAALAPAAEVARAGVRVAQARLELEHAEHLLQSSRVYLAAAMGERSVLFGETVGDLYSLPVPAPLDELLARVEKTPDFESFIDEARLRDAQIRLAQVQRRPDIRAEVGVRRFEADGGMAVVAGISMPLQSRSRARFGVDVAEATRAKTESEREAAYLQVRAQLLAQYSELKHSLLEAGTLRGEIIPRLEQALSRTEYAYERGRYSYLELADVQRELLQARRRVADVAADFHTIRIEIERLTGQSLDVVGVTP